MRSAAVVAFMAVLALVLAACSESPTPPRLGTVVVTVETVGDAIDADGYTVSVGMDQRPIASSGSLSFSLEVGVYVVALGDVADNCSAAPSSEIPLTIIPGTTQEVAFDVTCVAPPEEAG